jgi:hypothetical protein
MHMKCVLKGTTLAECNMGKAPSVTKTNLSALNCEAITSETTCSHEDSMASFLGTSNWNKGLKCNTLGGIGGLRFQSLTDMGTNKNGHKMFAIKWPMIKTKGLIWNSHLPSDAIWMGLQSGCTGAHGAFYMTHGGRTTCNAICRACGSVRADGEAFSGSTDHEDPNNPCGRGYPQGAIDAVKPLFDVGPKEANHAHAGNVLCTSKKTHSPVTSAGGWLAAGSAKSCEAPMKTCMCRTGY